MILKIIIVFAGFILLLRAVGTLTLAIKIRNQMRQRFEQRTHDPVSPAHGDVIEGEYKVLDEKEKK